MVAEASEGPCGLKRTQRHKALTVAVGAYVAVAFTPGEVDQPFENVHSAVAERVIKELGKACVAKNIDEVAELIGRGMRIAEEVIEAAAERIIEVRKKKKSRTVPAYLSAAVRAALQRER